LGEGIAPVTEPPLKTAGVGLIVIWLTVAREAWMREQRAKLARGNEVAKAMDYYMLKRWTAFTPASSTTVASACPTMLPNAARVAWPSLATGRRNIL
jgi:hypothetical protein